MTYEGDPPYVYRDAHVVLDNDFMSVNFPSASLGPLPHDLGVQILRKYFDQFGYDKLIEKARSNHDQLTGEHHGQAEQEGAARTGRAVCGSQSIGGAIRGAQSGGSCGVSRQEEVRGREDGEDGCCGTQERLSV